MIRVNSLSLDELDRQQIATDRGQGRRHEADTSRDIAIVESPEADNSPGSSPSGNRQSSWRRRNEAQHLPR